MVQMALVACIALPFSALADDLTVAQGDQPVTISADATYGAVVVNGELSVAPNVTLTCTSLTVANNINGTATLTIGDGAVVSVTGSDKTKIGVGSGRAEVYLGTGSRLSASGDLIFCYGYDSVPGSGSRMTEALLVVGTNSTVYAGDEFYLGHDGNSKSYGPSSSADRAVVKAEVRLDKGANLTAQRIRVRSNTSDKFIFNGGQITQRSSGYNNSFIYFDWDAQYTSIHLEGTNGCPVQLYLTARGSMKSLIRFGSNSCKVLFTGDGGFLKTGPAVFPLADMTESWDSDATNIRFLFTGDFVISEGGLSVANAAQKSPIFAAAKNNVSRPVDLVVRNGASFDLAGCDIVMNSITAVGSGIITNSVEGTANATIGVRNDGRGSTFARVYPGIAFVKQGNTTETLCGSEIDSLDIRGGTLVLKDRAHMGYPFYRVKFDRSGLDDDSTIDNAMRIREFAFFTNRQDVTRPYSKAYYDTSGTSWITSPALMFDGNLDTVYEDYRMHKAIDNSDRDKVQISLEYPDCRVVDSYRWAPYNSSEFQYRLSPTAWRVFGGFSPTDTNLLDQVTGFYVPGTTDDGWNTTNFVCSYEGTSTTIGTINLANGVALSIDGADVTVSSATVASGVPITLAHGATLTLPEETEISSLTIDLGNGGGTLTNFLPSENGAINITRSPGVMARGVPLPVRVENLVADRLFSWKVYIGGEPVENAQLTLNSDGYLVVRTGFILFVL